MAFFNRKLFPLELPKPSYMEPRTDAFSSLSCPPFCFPHCPDGGLHVPFPDHERADDDHYSFHHRRRHDHENLNIFVVIMIILVVLSALALCFSVMCVHIFRRRRNRRGIPIMVAGLDHARDHVDDDHHQGRDDFVVEDEERGGDGMPVEHHVWYINTVGLQSSVINSLPVCKYKRDDGVVEGTVCAVCLSEVQEGEGLRLLPKCNHAFHVSCIDTWLRSHTNCPMCRAPIVAKTPPHHPDSQLPPTLSNDHFAARDHHLHLEPDSGFSEELSSSAVERGVAQLSGGKSLRRTFSTSSCMVRAVSKDSHSIDVGKMGAQTEGAVGEGSSSSLPSSLLHRGLGSMKRSISCSGKFMSSS